MNKLSRYYICFVLLLLMACNKGEDCNGDNYKTYLNAKVNDNVYYSLDKLICVRNSQDTLLLDRKMITPLAYTKKLCSWNCGMSGGCPRTYHASIFTITYATQDNSINISITRNFYSIDDIIEPYYNDQYEYVFNSLNYTLPGSDYDSKPSRRDLRDSIQLRNGKYLSVSKISNRKYIGPNNYLYYGQIFLEKEKIVRYINLQTEDTLDFIN